MPLSFPLVLLSFLCSLVQEQERRAACPLLCREQNGPLLSSRTELPSASNALLLAESFSSTSSFSSAASLGGTELPPPHHEHLLQPGPLWGAAGLEAVVPPLRMGGDAMGSPLELLFAFLRGFPLPAAPASSAFLLPKCLHCFPRSAVFL